jgi:hypothetical protein
MVASDLTVISVVHRSRFSLGVDFAPRIARAAKSWLMIEELVEVSTGLVAGDDCRSAWYARNRFSSERTNWARGVLLPLSVMVNENSRLLGPGYVFCMLKNPTSVTQIPPRGGMNVLLVESLAYMNNSKSTNFVNRKTKKLWIINTKRYSR